MEQDKKTLYIITNYETILRETIDWYNKTYNTDFEVSKYLRDEVNRAVVLYNLATENDAFQLGVNFGRMCEAFDKGVSSSLPPGYFDNPELYPQEFR